jgi:hypothetical protein
MGKWPRSIHEQGTLSLCEGDIECRRDYLKQPMLFIQPRIDGTLNQSTLVS